MMMTGEFMIPLKDVAAVRDDFTSRARSAYSIPNTSDADLSRQTAVVTVWEHAAARLQGLCNDARAAGKGAPRWDDPTVEELAVARLLQIMATREDREHERLTEVISDAVLGTHGMSMAARRGDARIRAERLWHALLIVMEHVGIGPEQLLTEDDLGRLLDPVPPSTGR